MSYSVYKHTFPNGKVYIGITSIKPKYRWGVNGKGYLTKKKDGNYCQPLMARAVLKYNWDDIEHSVLFENLSKEEAEKKEIELISYYHSNDREFGYNIDNGGNCIGTHSEETRRKLSEAHKGKIVSEETRRKLSEMQKGENGYWYGKSQSEETKNKRRKTLKEFHKNNVHWAIGTHLSKEHKEKISKANKGKKMSEESIKKLKDSQDKTRVRCIETGEVYESIAYVRNELGVKHVWSCCNGKRKTAGGYHWEYVEENKKKKTKEVTEETKRKLSKAAKNRVPVRCVETDVVYESASQASRETGVSQSGISCVCRGVTKTSGGLHWELVKEGVE